MDSSAVRSKHDEFLFPCVANYYQEPLVLTEGDACCVRDADGRDYLDFFSGILIDPAENRVEFLIVDVESIMVAFQHVAIVEIHGQGIVDHHRSEVPGGAVVAKTENSGEETS